MYEAVVIGNPAFSAISSPQRNEVDTLSGPAPYSIRTLIQLGHRHVAVIGSVGKDFYEHYRQSILDLGGPEYFILDSEATGGFEFSDTSNGELHMDRCKAVGRRIGVKSIPDEFLESKAILLSPMLQEIDEEFVQWVCDSSDVSTWTQWRS